MKVIIDQLAFLEGLKTVARAVSTHNTLPVLGNILLEATDNGLVMKATNLELSLTTKVAADVKETGAITVPAKTLTSYVSLMPGGEVELSMTPDLGLSLKGKSSKTKIKGIDASEFPAIAKVTPEQVIVIPSQDFRDIVHEVAFAAQENATRPILSGVLLKAVGDKLSAVATDSYRLSEKKISIKKVSADVNCLVPVRAMREADRIASKEKDIEIAIGKNQILFRVGNAELTTRLIDGNFPPYEQIIPKEKLTTATVDLRELEMAVRRVSLFAKENNQNMKLEFNAEGNVKVFSDQTEIGSDENVVNAKIDGKANMIAINADYLLDLLSSLDKSSQVILEIKEKMNPAVFKIEGREDFLHLIMPLKV